MRFRTTGVLILFYSVLFTLVAFGQKFQSQPLNSFDFASYNYQIDKSEYIPQLSSELFQLYDVFTSNGDFVQFAKKRNLKVIDKSVVVTLQPQSGYTTADIANGLSEYNVVIEAQASRSMRCQIPINQLREVASEVRGIRFISNLIQPITDAVDGEGTYLMNADTWQGEGVDGSGVQVAIVDGGFQKLSDAQANGDIPPTYYGKDYTGNGLESETEHGTAVAEAAYEVAPGSDYYYYHIGDLTDLEMAKDDLVSQGVDVVNHSMSWFVQSYYDGTGPVSDIVADAINNDVVWCNSAGNRADSHYRDVFTEATEGFHDMDGEGHRLNFLGPEPGYVWLFPRFYLIQLWMNWDAYPTTDQDYDLYLYRYNDSNEEWEVVASATNRQDGTIDPVETIGYFNTVDEGKFAFAVKKHDATIDVDFTVFVSDPIANRVYSSSITDPGVYEDVVTVGAIPLDNYGSGPQEDFSGQGPTTDGRPKPNVAGPDSCNSYAYGYWQGTSQSSPYVAGASALVRSRFSTYNESQVRDYLYTECAVDLGDPGFDYIYGYGKLVLPEFESITVTSPNGGENWQVASSQDITWNSDGTSGTVSLEYSVDNGSNWSTIISSTTDDGVHPWTIPDNPSDLCLVRVSDTDGAPEDVSDAVFTISSANTPPTATDVTLSPATPLTGDDLVASYTYSDNEGDPESGSEIRWYRDSALMSAYDDQLTVGSSETNKGEQWYFTVRPSDGVDFGTLQTSNTVTIGNTAPQASDVVITPATPYESDDLQVSYTYNDADGDAESGSEIRWYQNGALVSSFNDQATVPASATAVNDEWYYTISPNDGSDFGALQTSSAVTILEDPFYQITDLTASVDGENILLEWSELDGATEYNVYRGTSYDFQADVANGTNRIAERITDEDAGTPGVQWTDTGNGADIVGDVNINYFYRVTGLVSSESQTTGVSKDRHSEQETHVVMGGTPHTAFGQVFNADASMPADGDVEFESYVTTRPGEVLTESSTGCSYSGGYWSVGVGNFSTAWSVGEVLQTKVHNLVNGETGSVQVALTDAGSDEADALILNSETESEPSNVAGEFDIELLTTATTDINELVVIMNTTGTRSPITTAEELAQAIPNCTDVYYWSASGQGQVGHPKGTPIENFDIEPGYPYIVNVSANTVWTNAGSYSMPVFNLITTSGTDINHIGIPFEKSDLTTADALGQDIPNCTDVYYWDVPGQGQIGHPVGTPVEDFPVYPAHAYYVNVTAETTWPESGGTTVAALGNDKLNKAQTAQIGSNVPHTVYGRLFKHDEQNDLRMRAWIVGREAEVLTHETVGNDFDREYWWVGVGNFPTSWQAGERLVVEFRNADGDLYGRQEVELTHAGSDKAEAIELGLITDVAQTTDIPTEYELLPNYPNPFNPSTTLRFGLPVASHVKVSLYTMSGRLIRTLMDGHQTEGYHDVVWDGRNESGLLVSSGVYLCRIESGDWQQTMKLVFAK